MELAHDYSVSHNMAAAFGGAGGLQSITRYAKTLEVNSCPFCGHTACLVLQDQFGAPAVAVECSHCHCRTVTSGPSYNYLTAKYTDIYDAINEVQGRWNRRTAA